jgi:hypothetical protein
LKWTTCEICQGPTIIPPLIPPLPTSRSSSARGFGGLLASDFAGGRACGRLPGLQGPPRSPDRTRSPVAVSRKREYFKYPLETIGDFALRLSKLGAWRRRTNLQRTAIGGHSCDVREYNFQLKGGFEPRMVESKSAASIRRCQGHHEVMPRCIPVTIVRREGVYVWEQSGRRYIDMIGVYPLCPSNANAIQNRSMPARANFLPSGPSPNTA